jgi:tricorn protease
VAYQQLTFYPARGPLTERWGYDNQVYGWTPDGKRVLFRSLRDGWTLVENHLYTVSAEGGQRGTASDADGRCWRIFSDGKQMVYSPLFRDFRSEKRYGGGQANRLWIFDLAGKTAKPISEGPARSGIRCGWRRPSTTTPTRPGPSTSGPMTSPRASGAR